MVSADLFCRVVDNLGDIGVMWRLARQLTKEKNWHIRLWVDRLESFQEIEPAINPNLPTQICQDIQVCLWMDDWQPTPPRQVAIAGFSCELPDDYIRQLAAADAPIWLQLEYLSAQDWVSSFHGLHSKRNDSLRPVFFFPGFHDNTGGLIREHGLIEQRNRWVATQNKQAWLASLGIRIPNDARLISFFAYPHAPLHTLIEQLRQTRQRFHLLVPSNLPSPNNSSKGYSSTDQVSWQAIKFMQQENYDKLLWSCDLNFVRGEDSFVRAIWAGKPLFWQIYPQIDGAHHPKLDAWLKLTGLADTIGQAMHEWADGLLKTDLSASLTDQGWQEWERASQKLSDSLETQVDLATRLDNWVRAQSGTANRL